VRYTSNVPISSTLGFPTDTTIPQITEGASSGASVTLNVLNAASDIEIVFSVSQISVSSSQHVGLFVFRGSEADAVGGAFFYCGPSLALVVHYRFIIPAGSAGSKTFTLRYGGQASVGTPVSILSIGGTNYMGAANQFSLSAQELPPAT
jgi:hypothetical protein